MWIRPNVFKAAGAEIVSRTEDVRRGCVCVGAALASRLSGNWVSALLFRRCLSSVVDDFFAIGSAGEKVLENTILPLSRTAAEELQLLAISSPWMVSNVAAGFSKTIYASDASLASGAYMSAVMWVCRSQRPYG